jgi:hypothetical protein
MEDGIRNNIERVVANIINTSCYFQIKCFRVELKKVNMQQL